MNKNISELSRNGNDLVNMSFRIASLNAGKINPKKNIKIPIFGLPCVKLPKYQTQHLVLNLSVIYWINQ